MVEDSLSRQELLKQAQEATRRRDWPEAIRCWGAVRVQYPSDPRGYFQAGNALRLAGHVDEAEALLAKAIVRFPANQRMAVAHARAANARRDWPTALMRWEAVRKRFPDLQDGYIGGAEALRALGRPDEATGLLDHAVAALAAARKKGLAEESAWQAELELATARNDWQTLRQSAEKLIAVQATPTAQTSLALARACWHLKDLDAAESVVRRALTDQPTLVEAVLIGAWVAAERGDGEKALSYYRTLVRLRPDNLRWSLQLVRTLNLLGRVKEAASELGRVVSRWPDDPLVRTGNLTHGLGVLAQSDAARGGQASAKGEPSAAEREFPELAAKSRFRKSRSTRDPTQEEHDGSGVEEGAR